ncbi:F-box domain-containing protein [Mycena chlorophos]|uniref:F-box domain-containing protein n=1 Tax=Mycena chlorophos TaxID=658473 RepID=A0A8H6T288_MYCCL|nr:F-box domain-containing protein [Mycena chlorophos]
MFNLTNARYLQAISKLFLRHIPAPTVDKATNDASPEPPHTPILTLPAELLTFIFQLALESEAGTIGVFPQTAFVASHVCTRWRILVLTTPWFWTRIDFSSVWKMQQSVERSGTLPLVLRVDVTMTGYDHRSRRRAGLHAMACEALEMPTVRMRAKEVAFLVGFVSERMQRAFGAEFPNLERLWVRATRRRPVAPGQEVVEPEPEPLFSSLRILKLGASATTPDYFLHRAGDGLQTLELDTAVTADVLASLAGFPNLATLKLTLSREGGAGEQRSLKACTLPKLRFLILAERLFCQNPDLPSGTCITSCASFLSLVRLPLLVGCTLMVDRIPAGPARLMRTLDRILAAHYSAEYRRIDLRLQRDDATTRYHCGNLDFPSYHVDLSFRFFPAEWAASSAPRELILSWHHSELLEGFADVVPASLDPTASMTALPALSKTLSAISNFQLVGWEFAESSKVNSPSLRCDWATILDGLAAQSLGTMYLEDCSPVARWTRVLEEVKWRRGMKVVWVNDDAERDFSRVVASTGKPLGDQYEELGSTHGQCATEWEERRWDGFREYMAREWACDLSW